MNEIRWVPGFIRLTSRAGTTYWACVAEIVQFSSGTRGDTHGSCITLRGEDEGDRFVLETPDQIGELMRQEWEGSVSLRAEIERAVESGEAA
jgi:hypothetical protein